MVNSPPSRFPFVVGDVGRGSDGTGHVGDAVRDDRQGDGDVRPVARPNYRRGHTRRSPWTVSEVAVPDDDALIQPVGVVEALSEA